MNKIHNIIWSKAQNAWVVVAEGTKSVSKAGGAGLKVMIALIMLSPVAGHAATLPQGGTVTVGQGTIVTNGSNQMVIKQTTDKLGINWQSFNVGADGHVIFDQPGANSVALNRVIGSDGSSILGKIDANGQVFIINPNGVIFGKNAQVNVGALVASTLDITDKNFKDGSYTFDSVGGKGVVENNGSIQASSGGYVALIGKSVKNQGLIKAQLGTAGLAAGDSVTLDVGGDGLINLKVSKSAVGAQVSNHGLIVADGGQAIMTARAANDLTATVVNNDGIIQARTINNREGKIFLDGGFDGGVVSVAGTLDASAPETGNGGFIETSGTTVKIASDVKVTTLANTGKTGEWLIDPVDFNINAGDAPKTYNSIGADTLSAQLESTSVTISTSNFAWSEPGDINVNAGVSWGANTKLTLKADRDINIKDNVYVNGESGGLAMNYGGRINVLDGSAVKLNGANTTYSENGKNFEILRTASDLNKLSGAVSNKYYVLGGDIDASVTSGWNGGLGYDPSGSMMNSFFSSVLNGLGNTISNLYINRPGQDYVGLIGNASNSTISNINVNGNVTGKTNVGLVAGQAYSSSVYNVTSNGNVTGNENTGSAIGQAYGNVIVENVEGNGNVTGETNTGGVIGFAYSNAKVNNITSYSKVTGNGSTGGVIGYSYANDLLSNLSYSGIGVKATGSNTGGVIGKSFADNKLTGLNTSFTKIEGGGYSTGGAIGMITGAAELSNIDVYGAVWGKYDVGGAVGYIGDMSSGNIHHLRSAAMVNGLDNIGGVAGEVRYSTLHDVYSSGMVTGTGSNTGGVVGFLGDSTLSNSASVNTIKGSVNVGGIVGNAENSSVSSSFSASSVEGSSNVGGFAGQVLGGSFQNSYATGAVTGWSGPSGSFVGSSQNAAYQFTYATGINKSNSSTTRGGYAGSSDGDTMTQSFWDVDSTGLSTSDGNAEGKTSAEMLLSSTYDGWNLDTTGFDESSPWRIYEGHGRPVLKFSMGTIDAAGKQTEVTYNGSDQVFIAENLYDMSGEWNRFYSGLWNPDDIFSDGSPKGGALTEKNAGNYTVSDLYSDQFGYNIRQTGSSTLVINKAQLVFDTTALDKVYDGTKSVNGSSITTSGLGGDNIHVDGFTASFVDKNAGANKDVEFTNLIISGDGIENYTWDTTVLGSANISKANLNVSAGVSDKVYDGTTAASSNITYDKINGDDLVVNGSASYLDKNAGLDKVVVYDELEVSGADAHNYYWDSNITGIGSIDKATLNVTLTGQDKVYDGTLKASVSEVDDRIAGDSLVIDYKSAFANKNAGNNKNIYISDLSVTGADAGNYNLVANMVAQADIHKAGITVVANPGTKVSGSSDTPLSWSITSGSLYGSDAISGSLIRDKGEQSGKYAINQGTLSAGDNYNLTFVASQYEITRNMDLKDTQEAVSVITASTGSPKTSGSGAESSTSGGSGNYGLLNLGMKMPDDLLRDDT
ncbi:YDG domain-containing protein [Pseudomonas putida]|uniref:Filamentous hemagglutinin N-terminal domain-containing protein n=1 Tax=Pseudomonas putida TaxID=303 RepID=A0A8I1JG29_PSEPU|nr:YDG domain-containing protein [Pseudomonas putida]MBI6882397.1 filamentous hemagglutinin N-terminal domain-containing protein [Pseudomonas putida]